MTIASRARQLIRGTSLRSRVAVLAALVAILTVISGVAFLVVALQTETVVTRQHQQQLVDAVARLAHDYEAHAQYQAAQHDVRPLDAPARPGSDDVLTAITTAAFAHDIGVEGGFYARVADQLVGYAFPTHEGPGVKHDIPPIERPLIEDVARRAVQDRHTVTSVFHGPRDVILFNAAPVLVDGAIVGSAWGMQRLAGVRTKRSASVTIGAAAFTVASLLCVGLAFVLARGVRRGVGQIEDRLHALESDLAAPMSTPFAGLEELARIHDGIDRLATSLRDRITSEQTLRQTLEHKERLAAVGQVAAGVAHELRNPLATIRLRAQMIDRANADPDLRRSVAMVLEEIARLDHMVERLLSFSRPIALRLRDTRIADLLCESTTALDETAQAMGVTIETRCDPEGRLRCDPDRLRQVLDNVLRNAIEASPAGGIVAVGVELTSEHVSITVQDHGPGLPEGAEGHVFEPFFTTKASGTGLGLSIAYEIVGAHEGRLEIVNSAEGGALVSICLPVAGPRVAAPKQALTA